MSFREDIRRWASNVRGKIVLAEGWDPRIRAAAARIEEAGMAAVEILRRPLERDERLGQVADLLLERKPDRVRSRSDAEALAAEPVYFAAGLVALGEATSAVAGAVYPTPEVIRAALWAVGPAEHVQTVSSAFYMSWAESPLGPGGERVLTFTDAGVVPEPSAAQLGQIALSAARDRGKIVGDEPRVAFLSYSSKGSASGAPVERVLRGLEEFRSMAPDVVADGELQGDAALVPEVAERKAPGGALRGRANVLVFPDLDSGNIAYKLVQRLGRATATGPILQGLRLPVGDLSRGATADDVIDVAAITLLQAITPEESA